MVRILTNLLFVRILINLLSSLSFVSIFFGIFRDSFFIPIILFRKVKIADIILDNLHISFCIILDYIFLTDNIHFLFLAIIFFILSLPQLLLKQKGGSFKSYQLSFLFSIMLHYEILMDHVLVPNF